DHALRRERDEVARLLLLELVHLDEPELDRRRDDALFEVEGVEAEVVAEELDDVVVTGGIVRVGHGHAPQSVTRGRGSARGLRFARARLRAALATPAHPPAGLHHRRRAGPRRADPARAGDGADDPGERAPAADLRRLRPP